MKETIKKAEQRMHLEGDKNEHILSAMNKMASKVSDQMLLDPDNMDPQKLIDQAEEARDQLVAG